MWPGNNLSSDGQNEAQKREKNQLLCKQNSTKIQIDSECRLISALLTYWCHSRSVASYDAHSNDPSNLSRDKETEIWSE